ncbi:sensor histidine kinase [Euzebya tangerina]|uniref:sensor histidine kinase n=1 Tax=Euzebya tangerina TaxID=591198 RepID=UPI000E324511|nr:histidine kinase [Euzebya tangerina]
MAELQRQLGQTLDGPTATVVADAARLVLGGRGVVVTDLDRVLATRGEVPEDSEATVVTILDRRRWADPVVQQAQVGGLDVAAACAVIAIDGVPIGTIHLVHDTITEDLLASLDALAQLVATGIRTQELESQRGQAARSELHALRAQISPHFIHNSLTAIAGLVHREPGTARELLSKFAEFLRSSFRTTADLIPLADELRLVEIYLDLERTRFGDRFEVSLRVAPEVLTAPVPALSIQPLVENAIRHGLEPLERRGRLRIRAVDAQTEVSVVVEDDGVGTDPEALQAAMLGNRATRHIGVLAVDERLRSTFGPEYGLMIRTGPDRGTEVTMRVPKSGALG